MIRRFALPLLLLAASAHAEPEAGSFHAMTLSLGPGRPVCATVTFDRRIAEAGGRVLVLDSAGDADEQAIRLSEAVIIRRGGLSSRAAAAARRHGVPAVSLGQGRWDEGGAALYLDEPSYGQPIKVSGFAYRPVVGSEERVLREGDAVVVDAASGEVSLVPAVQAQARVEAAEAARAFDGLRDVQALEQWLGHGQGEGRAAALLEELVPRAVTGTMSPEDLTRVRRAAERLVSAASREGMRRAETAAFTRSAREAKRRALDCAEDAKVGLDAGVLEDLAEEARAEADGVAAVARMLSLSDGGAAASARACRAAATRRAKSRAGKTVSFEEAAQSAGADRPEGSELAVGAWRRFVDGNSLSEWLQRTVDDASLGLRRKSERIRERILAGRLDASEFPVLRAITGPVLLVGEAAAMKAAAASEASQRLKEVWAASWAPGPLGARLRAGKGLDYDGRIRVETIMPADASGLVFSRDPGSGRRERIFVDAASGSFDAILAGDAQTDSYTLDRLTGRAVAPRRGAAAPALTPERLERLARLARALDAWKGAGVEVAFSFSGERLIAHHARALLPPRPVLPLADPFAPRPDAQYLNIKSVGR